MGDFSVVLEYRGQVSRFRLYSRFCGSNLLRSCSGLLIVIRMLHAGRWGGPIFIARYHCNLFTSNFKVINSWSSNRWFLFFPIHVAARHYSIRMFRCIINLSFFGRGSGFSSFCASVVAFLSQLCFFICHYTLMGMYPSDDYMFVIDDEFLVCFQWFHICLCQLISLRNLSQLWSLYKQRDIEKYLYLHINLTSSKIVTLFCVLDAPVCTIYALLWAP